MQVPDNITVRIISDEIEDLSGLIVEITIFTGKRNPRRLHFPKTEHDGCTTMTRGDLVGQFEDETQFDLMGSWGNLEDALPVVEISLHDTSNAVAAGKCLWPLGKHEKTKWSSPEAEYAYRISSRNQEFRATPVKADLRDISVILLAVTRLSGRTG